MAESAPISSVDWLMMMVRIVLVGSARYEPSMTGPVSAVAVVHEFRVRGQFVAGVVTNVLTLLLAVSRL
jgi:hypothetical protein